MKHQVLFPALIFLVLILTSCFDHKDVNPIVAQIEIEQYLQDTSAEALKKCDSEIEFWDQRKQDATSLTMIAGIYSSRFKLSGDPRDIKKSDSLLMSLVALDKIRTPDLYHLLAANAISQHKFREAENFTHEAYLLGDQMHATLLLSIDVNMELGNVGLANETLNKFTNRNSFSYLIRKSKIKDHQGDIDSAIFFMEKAVSKVKNNKSLFLWAQSNLADMYGHAGMVQESYNTHLSVLKTDPSYDHSLKSIAWIAFSHDHNFNLAKNIIYHLQTIRPVPDYQLMLAEIAEAEGNEGEESYRLNLYVNQVGQPRYGFMHAKYLALLNSEKLSKPEVAISIAQQEISRRPCPQSYDLLAWGYLHNGDPKAALDVIESYLVEVTFEPEALYHMGMIYKANGMKREAIEFLKTALESTFELGPSTTQSIERALKELS